MRTDFVLVHPGLAVPSEVAHRLQEARIRRGMTLNDVAALLDCSRQTIHYLETEKTTLSYPMIHQLCRVYGISPFALIMR